MEKNNMTAVEWLANKIESQIHHTIRIPREIIEQAKQMEKEQIVEAYSKGYMVGENDDILKYAKEYSEKYYNKIYESNS